MRAEEGKRVKISFTCREQDGTPHDLGVENELEFVIGLGKTLPSLEKAVIGMTQGEKKLVRVPNGELREFPLYEGQAPAEPHRHREIMPGPMDPEKEEDVVILPPPAQLAPHDKAPPSGLYLLFEITLLEVEER